MLDKKFLGALALVLCLGAGCATTNPETTQNDQTNPDTSAITAADNGLDISDDTLDDTPETTDDNTTDTADQVKTFTVTGNNFTFSPSTMSVKKGDTVRVVFKNTVGFHDFVIDEFDVATKQIQGGAEETVEFVADKAGSFEYYCSVGSHRQMGMKGTLTVTE